MHDRKLLLAYGTSSMILVANVLGALVYLWGASHAWVIPEEAANEVHSITGEPFVWASFVLPVWILFLIINLIWGLVIVMHKAMDTRSLVADLGRRLDRLSGDRFRAPLSHFEWIIQQMNPPKSGTRNCSGNSASAGQDVAATAQVALLTGQFFSGLGSSDQNFGPNTATSQVMAQSGPVQDVLNQYYMTGATHDLYSFGAQGYAAAGANPVAQFVGSFRWSIASASGGINLTLINTTSFKSLTYDKGPHWQRGSVPTPMGNTHQIYNVFVPCGA